jgi:hypothetical protein
MAVTNTPWDGSAARYTPEQWKRATLIDTGEGDPASKDRYKLPVYEPNGDLNQNALGAAAGALNGARGKGVQAPPAAKKAAAKKLIGLYRQAKMDPPDSLKSLAS